jgi:tRNA-specific 2-thiouridylase
MTSFDSYIHDRGLEPGDMTVMVAMSGGVDSSVAAALLLEGGFRVVGATMRLWCLAQDDRGAKSCCSAESLDDAKSVCRTLGIPHYVIDLSAEFEQKIVEPFCFEYLAGRTPNPCVACNTEIKFADFLARAKAMGAHLIATGHYVRQGVNPETGRTWIKKGLDGEKDQSYALWGLTQPVLRHTVFPIGWLTKDEVRERARALNLSVADKPESQDVCFIPEGDISELIHRIVPQAKNVGRGEVKSLDGETLGHHEGYYRFTVGQRRGLGIATGQPQYVTHVDPEENVVYLGDEEDLTAQIAYARDFSFVDGEPPAAWQSVAESNITGLQGTAPSRATQSSAKPPSHPSAVWGAGSELQPCAESARLRGPRESTTPAMPLRIAQAGNLNAKIRYLHSGAPGTIEVTGKNAIRFIFDEPQRAITPGQSLVVYDGETLLGGGIIERAEW